jgi:Tol biopolymer transport system component
MKRFAVLALLAVAIAALGVGPASAKSHEGNGLIAFTSFEPTLHQDVVFTINPDGSGQQQLLAGAEAGGWSPDGTRIALLPDCCNERIVNPDNGNYTELPTSYPELGLDFLGCGVWSPDGSRLACEGFGAAGDGIYSVRSSDGGDVQRVTAGADDDCPGGYSPNGKQLVFLRASFDSGVQGLFIVRTDGSDLHQITPDGMNLDFSCGSWSPQGNEILFSGKTAEGRRSALFAVHTDGTGLRQLPVAGCGSDEGCHGPGWSPDGKEIAFTRFDPQTGQSDLYTVNPDGSDLRQVTHDGGVGGFSWGTHPLNQ